ncbi:MAG: hypothetical protein ACKV0T_23505 [Planctomycetales bacterium]
MKTCVKSAEPAALSEFRRACPKASWKELKDDALHGGQAAFQDINRTTLLDQRCLCARCEIYLAFGTALAATNATKANRRIEHFHPKSDFGGELNWGLHWPNLWAVCQGGTQRPPEGEPLNIEHFLSPLPDNLSCDASKDHHIDNGRLPVRLEGYILAPDEVPPFPPLFVFT